MRRLRPLAAGPEVPALAFGCASLGGRTSERDAQRALQAAWDEGIRYFDTARSYGYGDAERILGSFLAGGGRRAESFVATKAGIRAGRSSPAKRLAKGVARAVFDRAPGLRHAAQGLLGRQHRAGNFEPAAIRVSVEESLQALGIDYVDLLLLHDCPLAVGLDTAVRGLFDRLVEEGKARAWGLSTTPEVAVAVLLAQPDLAAVQMSYNLWDQGAARLQEAASGPLCVANQPLGGGRLVELEAMLQGLGRSQPSLRDRLTRPSAALEVALSAILESPLQPVVVCGMSTPAHVRANVAAARRATFSPEELATIRAFVAAPSS